MLSIGTCPHCGVRIEFASAPPPGGTCGACSGRYLVVVPDPETAEPGDELRLELVPRRAEGARAWLETRGLKRPVQIALVGAGLLAVAFVGLVVLGVLFSELPDAPVTRIAKRVFGNTVELFLTLPFTAALAVPVVWALFGGWRRRPPDLWRSVLAVTAGATLHTVASDVVSTGVWVFRPDPQALDSVRWSLSGLGSALACLVAGWATARLAPGAPFRHALGVGVILALPIVLLALPFLASRYHQGMASVLFLLCLPLLFVGARMVPRGAERSSAAPEPR